ncbi:MAG: hypothetical protein ACK521_08965 [bacterium]|jgi:hypothetical protein
MLPGPPRDGYFTEPDWSEIIKMSKDDLQKVLWFKIFNENGSVEFLGPTDLTNCDLAQLVEITPTSVEVYPNESLKPPRG